MKSRSRLWLRIWLFPVLLAAIIALIVLDQNRRNERRLESATEDESASSPATAAVSPKILPTRSTTLPDQPALPVAQDLIKLIIPVAGVRAQQLRDTFDEARSEGRAHSAIDILAPRGTPVLAAADGRIVRLFYSERGGLTLYQMSADQKYVFYYAHLDHYADGLVAGHLARQGEVIAYVGDTGNAGAGNYHLHFSLWLVTDPKRYWEGININPYPILRNALSGEEK